MVADRIPEKALDEMLDRYTPEGIDELGPSQSDILFGQSQNRMLQEITGQRGYPLQSKRGDEGVTHEPLLILDDIIGRPANETDRQRVLEWAREQPEFRRMQSTPRNRVY